MCLIICENSFDLHHNLSTSFSDYRKFLDEKYPDVVPGILENEYFFGVMNEDDYWTDVEDNLFFSYERMLEDSHEKSIRRIEKRSAKSSRMHLNFLTWIMKG